MSGLVNAFSKWYFNRLTGRLARMGLTYHDAVQENGIYYKAIQRLPEDMQVARRRRIQRAFDLSSKHVEVPAGAQEDPWREYAQVNKILAITQQEHDERKSLNGQWWMPYHMGREAWHAYDTKKAWFWSSKGKSSGPKKLLK